MKDLGDRKYILGMEIMRDRVNINLFLSYSKYVNSTLQHFSREDCIPLSVSIYAETKISIE
jgi:hypothetical protein